MELGVLESVKIKINQMKPKVLQAYYREVRKVLNLKSSLNGGKTVKAINTWAVAAVRYTACIVDQTAGELKAIDRKTRKLMTMNGAVHLRADVYRLYVTWAKGS